MEGSDLIIEAVFENVDLKDKVTKETEAVLGEDKIYGSNTSTIPISLLAKSSKRPQNFIGIHFFSPVDKMPLVEIIRASTSTPAKSIGRPELGTLKVGSPGDAVVISIEDGKFEYRDVTDEVFLGKQRMVAEKVVVGGEIWKEREL